MTCIVGIVHDGVVYMGGERAVSDGKFIQAMKEPKVVERGEYLFAYAGNIGIGQFVMNNFKFPAINSDIDRHMHGVFIPALRKFFKDNDMSFKEEDEVEFMIGVRGRLYTFHGYDLQLVSLDLATIGSGGGVAIGSLHTSSHWSDHKRRIKVAIEAAIEYTAFCIKPIDILSK